MIELRMLCIR